MPNPIFPARPEGGFESLSDEELTDFIEESEDAAVSVSEDAASYVSDDRDVAALATEVQDGVAALDEAREVLASRSETPDEGDDDSADEGDADGDAGDAAGEASIDDIAALANDAVAETADEGGDNGGDGDSDSEVVAEPEPVVASVAGAPTRRVLPRPGRSRRTEVEDTRHRVALTAAAPNLGPDVGDTIGGRDAADMMIRRRGQFGNIAKGTQGEKVPIAQLDWRDAYTPERTLDRDMVQNLAKIDHVIDEVAIRRELERRIDGALVASGGLCAPVTPYYDLQMLSVADRPVRAALPSFNADRGGLIYARPAALTAITTGVGVKTADQDEAGGTFAAKTCQVVSCPTFQETDVDIIYHCLQFGNLGARTFPERVTQWNNLVLAAHARVAESRLLTSIGSASTAVSAGNFGNNGASAELPSQVITAAAAIRSRHRMAPNAVLRALFPSWVLDLLVSDVYRTQFQRFDMDGAAFVALLRRAGVEPSFYVDSATGAGQVFGTQSASTLLTFPSTIVWYLFPEGSFLYLDGGTLELGLVRDSVLNETNDYQIFGETFESVAFVGVESYAVTSTLCDSGTVTLPQTATCAY